MIRVIRVIRVIGVIHGCFDSCCHVHVVNERGWVPHAARQQSPRFRPLLALPHCCTAGSSRVRHTARHRLQCIGTLHHVQVPTPCTLIASALRRAALPQRTASYRSIRHTAVRLFHPHKDARSRNPLRAVMSARLGTGGGRCIGRLPSRAAYSSLLTDPAFAVVPLCIVACPFSVMRIASLLFLAAVMTLYVAMGASKCHCSNSSSSSSSGGSTSSGGTASSSLVLCPLLTRCALLCVCDQAPPAPVHASIAYASARPALLCAAPTRGAGRKAATGETRPAKPEHASRCMEKPRLN